MQEKYVAILGHQPELSLAELESLYGVEDSGKYFASLKSRPDIRKLGGSPKVGQLIDNYEGFEAETSLYDALSKLLSQDKKSSIGLSFYGIDISPKQINNLLVRLKKRLSKDDIKIRFVPSKGQELNAAQVWNNKLDKDPNVELLIVKNGNNVLAAKTIGVQNIDAYTKRDREKPFRDAKNGMLPPKLARTLINLANPEPGSTLLDPFCGTGTVLIEALTDGLNVVGTDIETAMTEGTQKNLDWYQNIQKFAGSVNVYKADARNGDWKGVDLVVAETYLGPPISNVPSDIDRHLKDINELHKDFLVNLAGQISTGAKVVLAVPAIYDAKLDKYHFLPLVDELSTLQYNRLSFKSVDGELIYRRPDQVVARHILTLERS